MTNKVELNTLTQVVHKEQAFLTALNDNFLRLQQAINDTISRSGVVPNQMEEVLDMNGKRIVNVGAAVEDTDALTRGFIQGLIADVEAAVARLNSLVEQAKQALEVYAAEYILPPAIAARDAAIDARDAAQGYARDADDSYRDTKALYDQLDALVVNLNQLLLIAQNMQALTVLYNNIGDIRTVASEVANIETIANNIASILSAAQNITDINTVSTNISDVNTLAAAISDIHTVVTNLAAILAAPTYANNAATWAEGVDSAVQALGGTHSAKKWAELSQADVAAEAQTRQDVDNNLQSQIDAITAGANVKDIVGTYQDLQNYDTTSLSNQDIVKVISDSMHNDASSYYRWVITGGVGAWNYIGSEGPYLTPSAASETYVPKTTTINSKALSGNITLEPSDVGAATAAQGSKADTAVQSVTTGATNGTVAVDGTDVTVYGLGSAAYTPSTDYATSAQGTKADTALQPGANVSSLVNDAGYQVTSNLVTAVSSSSTDSQYPSAKLFYDTCGDIETLILAL